MIRLIRDLRDWISRQLLGACLKSGPDRRLVSQRIGRVGEKTAVRLLRKKGLRVLVTNFRRRYGELDIVAEENGVLVFVEVKTRSLGGLQRPANAVCVEKRRHIARAALRYLQEIGSPQIAFRFDIVEVVHDGGKVIQVEHIKNAFELPALYHYGG